MDIDVNDDATQNVSTNTAPKRNHDQFDAVGFSIRVILRVAPSGVRLGREQGEGIYRAELKATDG